MIFNLKKFKANKLKAKSYQLSRGMTYVEIIIVLSIFSVITSAILFNYGDFQAKIDIKNLGSDIALKAVEAQKSSMSGKLPPFPQRSSITSAWKPSYGLHFNLTSDNKSFLYFTDLENNALYDGIFSCTSECLEKISITKGNSISNLSVFYQGDPTPYSFNDLTITFSRPNSGAIVRSSSPLGANIYYVQITIVSPKSPSTAQVKLYASGRIQVN